MRYFTRNTSNISWGGDTAPPRHTPTVEGDTPSPDTTPFGAYDALMLRQNIVESIAKI